MRTLAADGADGGTLAGDGRRPPPRGGGWPARLRRVVSDRGARDRVVRAPRAWPPTRSPGPGSSRRPRSSRCPDGSSRCVARRRDRGARRGLVRARPSAQVVRGWRPCRGPAWNEALADPVVRTSGNRGGRRRRLPRRRRVPHHAERLGRADVPRDASAPLGPAGSRRLRARGKRSSPRREPARLRDRPLPGDGRSRTRSGSPPSRNSSRSGRACSLSSSSDGGSAFLARRPHTVASCSRRSRSSSCTAPPS